MLWKLIQDMLNKIRYNCKHFKILKKTVCSVLDEIVTEFWEDEIKKTKQTWKCSSLKKQYWQINGKKTIATSWLFTN